MAASASTLSTNSGTVRAVHSKTFGIILASANGRTLYRYTVDSKGVNRCSSNATCKKSWPALLMKAGAKPTAGSGVSAAKLGTIKAANGMRQVTYAGFPLYFFVGDKAAGQTKGQGFGATWYVVNTKGELVKHASGSPPAGTTTSGTTTSKAWG
jgi:predicted lipoprotein with Yx(FWY)xxD motif